MEEVILVDKNDNELGTMEKMEAHRKGQLHRAFSILIYNSNGEMLLQKRAKNKYHSGGLWTNACCSHPLPEESMDNATRRRLAEELGIDTYLEYSHKFIYKIDLDNDLTEHEYDHIYIGTYDGSPRINTTEVEDWKFVALEDLQADLKANPEHYTYWFKLIMRQPEVALAAKNLR